jgi:hypothetical protein
MAFTVVKPQTSRFGPGMLLAFSTAAMDAKPVPSRHIAKISLTTCTRAASLSTNRALHSLPGLDSVWPFA